MEYEIINPDEDLITTRQIVGRIYEKSSKTKGSLNAADCKIYMRGQVWIIQHEDDILYYETHLEAYPFFEEAFHYMNVEKRAQWKTVDELTSFRQAIREATVQGTAYCEMLEEPLSKKVYQEFMKLARAHDKVHHGDHTF